jgi:hypothetical protein
MCPQCCTQPRGHRRTAKGFLCLSIAAGVFAATGCEEEARHPATDSGPIIGQRTQQIRNANVELKQGKAEVGSTKIVAKDPITLSGNAHRALIGRAAVLAIQHAVDLFHAANDRYPKDYDEFMNEIIKANGIALPKLPPYQDYGYDSEEHKLIILEYPDRK